jgi:magnesium chelatase family protein
MNPCPCGWRGDASGRCACTPDQVARYRGRLSGPLLDRIDLVIDVPAPPAEALALSANAPAPESAQVRERVAEARERQRARQVAPNARLDAPGVARHCVPSESAQRLLAQAQRRLALSARGYHRVAKVARTIADLAGSEAIDAAHVAEAIGYRRFDGADRAIALR